jgi:hypothetical protein
VPVDHGRVYSIIVQWTWNAGAAPMAPMDPDVTEILRKELKAYRHGSPDPAVWTDLNVAAAEHYFLMRAWVGACTISTEQALAMTHGYDLAKIVTRAVGQEEALRHNPDRPTTPPDPDVVQWGVTGIAHGLIDRRAYRPDCTPPAFNMDVVTFRSPVMDRIAAARKAINETVERGAIAIRSILPSGY